MKKVDYSLADQQNYLFKNPNKKVENMATKEMHSNKIIKGMFLKLLPQQMIAGMVFSANTIIDSFFASHLLGSDGMAAIGFYLPISYIVCLCYVMITGTQIMCGNSIGAGNEKETVSIFSTCNLIILIFGIALGFVLFVFAVPVASLLGASGASLPLLIAYLRSMALGLACLMLYVFLITFLQLNNRTGLFAVSMITMIVTNIVLNYVFIHIFNMGMLGLGLATSISNILAVCAILPGFINSKRKPIVYLKAGNYCFKRVPEMLKLGSTQFAYNMAVGIRSFILNIILMRVGGADAVAVQAVFNIINTIVGMIPQGTSNSTVTIGSILCGEKNRQGMGDLVKFASKITQIMCIATIAVISIFAPQIAGAFYPKGSTVWSMTIVMLRIAMWWLISNPLCWIILKARQSQGQLIISYIYFAVENVLIVIAAFILSGAIGLNGIWLSYPTTEILACLVVVICIAIKLKKLPKSADDWAGVGDTFNVPVDDTLAFDVNSMDKVIEVSVTVDHFLKTKIAVNGDRNRICYLAGLAVEEMAGNIVEYGFKDNQKHVINIYVIYDRDKIIIRIRDNCTMFDPTQYLKQFSNEDPLKNVGIRMISKMAHEMSYQQLLGYNYLTINL